MELEAGSSPKTLDAGLGNFSIHLKFIGHRPVNSKLFVISELVTSRYAIHPNIRLDLTLRVSMSEIVSRRSFVSRTVILNLLFPMSSQGCKN